MEPKTIILDIEKFKEILIYSWKLLPQEKQQELLNLGIKPEKTVPKT